MFSRKHPVESKRDRGWPLALTWIGLGLMAGLLLLGVVGQPARARENAGGALDLDSPAAAIPYTTLVDVQAFPPETLDPHWLYDTASAHVAMQIYDTLVTTPREDPTLLLPQLATDWSASANVDVYTFTIRSGVRFHAGGSLEPHDVAYSLWRGMLQGRTDGGQWIAYEAFFGPGLAMGSIKDFSLAYLGKDPATTSFDDLTEAELTQVCEAIKGTVDYDDEAGTVTYHLKTTTPWFLALQSKPYFGAVLDQEWMAANGDWDGGCTTWKPYADPAAGDSLLFNLANGTGPYRLDKWSASEILLVRYDGYWRREPAWPEGPSGPAALETVFLQYVPDSTTRRDLLLAGQADLATIATADVAALEPWIWGRYDGYTDQDPTLLNPTGTLRLYRNLPSMGQTPAMLNYDINPTANPYIGSGALDGDGIPPDFFGDLHVRKAFSYAMDWPALIADAYGGEGIQARGPIPWGMLGYTSTQPTYPYSPTLSTQEFKLAWGGAVWSNGFSMTIPYNEDNLMRQRAAEILADNLAAINPAFQVTVVEMPWPDMLADRRNGLLPVYVGGWVEDYHHPHNWVVPFLYSGGAYAQVQNFPSALAGQFDAKIEECATVIDAAEAQTCYEEIQNLSYDHAAALWGVQTLERRYVRTEVRGYYLNPSNVGSVVYYALSKGAPPTLATAEPELDNTLLFTTTGGTSAAVDVPAGAVSETSTIAFTPDTVVEESHPGGFRLGGMAFDLQVCQDGECLAEYPFGETVTLTLKYDDADVAGLIEEALYLYTWDGSTWVDVVTDCGWPLTAYERHPEINELVVPVCHFSRFALVGDTYNAYLPIVLRE